MAHEIDRLFATPTMRPHFPEKSVMTGVSVLARIAGGMIGSVVVVAPERADHLKRLRPLSRRRG
jgi:hypothetical protein